MSSCQWFICIFVALFLVFPAGNATLPGNRRKSNVICPTIFVDLSGGGNFTSIQAAIDSVPSYNERWICISIKEGVYREQVTIPYDKPFIYLKGTEKRKTYVVWDAHDSIATSATFTSQADNIIANGLTFMNSYNYPPRKNGNPVKPALAAMISGDQSAFYECSFLGYQDTLLDDYGRHYFKLCTIEGAIDFIFGGGQSIYEKCTISVNAGILDPGSTGFIAAQARASPTDTAGFVFKQCNVTGKGKTFLGRAWKAYSRAIYYDSFLSDIVVPQGWDAWTYVGHENQLTFAEDQCQGPGSDKSNRIKWEKNLSPEELQSFTSYSYIDNDGWLRKIPLNIQD
ncbi:hypothetical protein Pfo_026629 [Paulownia fortunei]|nr:hypothetical protein Pfo_026629 [Paulownia fortunei]